MPKINRTAQAGTLESSDITVFIAPAAAGSGIRIDLESNVLLQYGDAIRATLLDVITNAGIHDVQVKAVDRGALDCTIRARTLTALARAGAAEGETA